MEKDSTKRTICNKGQMSELSEPEITTKILEHYGLVAAVCQKLRIAVGKALGAVCNCPTLSKQTQAKHLRSSASICG